jgi:hypothetical protein
VASFVIQMVQFKFGKTFRGEKSLRPRVRLISGLSSKKNTFFWLHFGLISGCKFWMQKLSFKKQELNFLGGHFDLISGLKIWMQKLSSKKKNLFF